MKHLRNWRRNAVVATVMLFICAGIYLNWSYTKNAGISDLTDTLNASQVLGDSTLVIGDGEDVSQSGDPGKQTVDYFASVRLSRQESRDQAVSALQETMAYEDIEAEKSLCAESLDAIINTALEEAQIESLIIAKGFEDCVTYIANDVVSVAVSAPAEGLSQSDVALISDVVLSQTDYTLYDIRIIEVN